MFRESISTERSFAGTALHLLQAAIKRLGELARERSSPASDRAIAENGFYVLDDVACIRIRQR